MIEEESKRCFFKRVLIYWLVGGLIFCFFSNPVAEGKPGGRVNLQGPH